MVRMAKPRLAARGVSCGVSPRWFHHFRSTKEMHHAQPPILAAVYITRRQQGRANPSAHQHSG
ncbi:hypothetical protein I553_3702 [Mycobacterium xenopi 4042]|uniref:Uncharacterized protein n=1 Tax=Mycobacterium xenopi 4042 TaxID=1299334 RepID=X7YSY1_MYCXE|nr:hypothetical protein I553_3702 [Mycobacterium xenopi 4042]